MKYLFFIASLFLLSFTRSSGDPEQIFGTWYFYELKDPTGKIIYSSDPEEQQIIFERLVAEQLPTMTSAGVPEADVRLILARQVAEISQVTFTFDASGSLKTLSGGTQTESRFTINETTKELTLLSGETALVYKYAFSGGKFLLDGKDEDLALVKR